MTSSGDEKATAADIWSLACTIIELLTGSPPYYALGTMQALYKMVQDPHPPLPPNLSSEMVSFLKACFVKDYKQRSTAEDLLKHPWILNYSSVSDISPSQMQATVRQHNSRKTSSSSNSLSSINWDQGNTQKEKENQPTLKNIPFISSNRYDSSEDDDEDTPNIKEINEDISRLKKEEQELLEMIEKKKYLLYQKNKSSSPRSKTFSKKNSPRKTSPRINPKQKSAKIFEETDSSTPTLLNKEDQDD